MFITETITVLKSTNTLIPTKVEELLAPYAHKIIHISRKEYLRMLSRDKFHLSYKDLIPLCHNLTFEVTNLLKPEGERDVYEHNLAKIIKKNKANMCYLNYFYYNTNEELRYNLQSLIVSSHISKIYIVRDVAKVLNSL